MKSFGVVIGRFQVPRLHLGHIALINAVQAAHTPERTVVLVGQSFCSPNLHDPLPADLRMRMVLEDFPRVLCAAVPDHQSDEAWSARVDMLVAVAAEERGAKGDDWTATIYGGRDSCLPHYSGRFPKQELPVQPCEAASVIRRRIDPFQAQNRTDFRAGMIYAHKVRFPVSYQTVDIACVRRDAWTREAGTGRINAVLMGKKGGGNWHFPGGFVDPADESLEFAAWRELREECGDLEVSDREYLGSFRVNDWRYRASPEGIMTAFYLCIYAWGDVRAGDDLEDVAWCGLDLPLDTIAVAHQPLWNRLLKYVSEEDYEKS